MSLSLKTRPLAVIDAIWRLSAAFAGGANVVLKQLTPKSAGATALPSAFHCLFNACGCSAAADVMSTSLRQHFMVSLLLLAFLLLFAVRAVAVTSAVIYRQRVRSDGVAQVPLSTEQSSRRAAC